MPSYDYDQFKLVISSENLSPKNVMPDISDELVGIAYENILVRYRGETTANFTFDTVYKCVSEGLGIYSWVKTDQVFTNRPMTELEAKNLLTRLKSAIMSRLGNIVDTSTESFPVKNDARSIKSPAETTGKLKTSRLNINVISDGDDFKIHDAPESYDAPDADVDLSPDQIMKAIDGIAILNSILNFNDINASTLNDAWKTIDDSIAAVVKTSTNADVYKEIKDGIEYKYNRINSPDIKNARQKLRDVVTLTYKDDNDAGYKIYGLVTPTSGDPASDQITIVNNKKKQAQKNYVRLTLSRELSGIIKYVQAFVQEYTLPGDTNTNGNQNITSAFDFYVLDYIVQILEAEAELFNAICDTNGYYAKREADSQGYYAPGSEYWQQNKAPFMDSMCNGACVGLCHGSCIGTCNGCGACTSYCTSECGGTCATTCALNCQGECKNSCINGCEGHCNMECTAACFADCNNQCGIDCTSKCISACATKCQNLCEGGCISSCNTGCKDGCKEDCGEGCQSSSASKNKPVKPNPIENTTKGTISTNGMRLGAVPLNNGEIVYDPFTGGLNITQRGENGVLKDIYNPNGTLPSPDKINVGNDHYWSPSDR